MEFIERLEVFKKIENPNDLFYRKLASFKLVKILDRDRLKLIKEVLPTLSEKVQESWWYCLNTLDNIATNSTEEAKLFHDFAPLSFYFEIQRQNGICTLNGGLIFHGRHDAGGTGGGPPTYSVNVTPVDGWTLHT